MREDGGRGALRVVGDPALLQSALQLRGCGQWRVRARPGPVTCAPEPTVSSARAWLRERRVGGGVRPDQKAGELTGGEGEGEGRPAGQHESAAAGAETAQPAHGPGRGDGAPPVPRPHQRGGPAGKSPGRPGSWALGLGRGVGSQAQPPVPVRGETGLSVFWMGSPPGLGRCLLLGPLCSCTAPYVLETKPVVRFNSTFFQHVLANVLSAFLAFTLGLQSDGGENCSTLGRKSCFPASAHPQYISAISFSCFAASPVILFNCNP